MERAELIIFGRVQGVFFRHSARIQAERLKLTGQARNGEDGNVIITAEGQRENLETFVAWCRKGPPLANVEDIAVRWEQPTGTLKGFRIL